MLQSFIIVFREILEIALVLSVLLAATRGLAGRGRWIGLGIAGGIAGSGVVAAFAQAIADMAEGMGQELFNGAILLAAALMIGWTVVWMKKHGRAIAEHVKKLGHSVREGELPMYSLSVVVLLAVLREGSEIVLFTYGALAAGTGIAAVILGGLGGLAAGAAVGLALYLGLIRIATRHLFGVTSLLLMFVAAGMAAQAAGYFSAAGILPELAPELWNSAAYVPESSLTGQILHALIGYSESPSGIQLAFYAATILTILLCLRIFAPGQSPAQGGAKAAMASGMILLGIASFIPLDAHAAPKIRSPIVDKGEWEVEWTGLYNIDHRDDTGGAQEHAFGIGHGITDRWFMEVEGEFEHEPDDKTRFTNIEWENKFQLFEQGEYWLDAGIYTEYKHSFENNHSDAVEVKLLLEKEWGQWVHTINLGLEREIGAHSSKQTEGSLGLRTLYRYNEYFNPGIEWHSEFGELRNTGSFSEQEHQTGPVARGRLYGPLHYDIAYLIGASKAAPDGAVRAILEYEWYF